MCARQCVRLFFQCATSVTLRHVTRYAMLCVKLTYCIIKGSFEKIFLQINIIKNDRIISYFRNRVCVCCRTNGNKSDNRLCNRCV